ncbi:aldehyde dehydrogenase family protein [Glutamicibacter ardleyensis]|uniref:aldehyde dehydrogenase family protein n=1 Tax=Glutamicibacter ardleyensis TaxID=225894 RepID=UPI003FD51FEA
MSTTTMTRDSLTIPYRHVDTHFINGDWVASTGSNRIEVTDPATAKVWGSVPEGTEDDVDAAVGAAHRALHSSAWKAFTPADRAALLLRIADEVEARATELSLTNTLENGSPVSETSGAAANAASIFRYFASLAPLLENEDLRPFPNGAGQSLVRRDPVGVCALIAPWNFPINLMVIKLAPALLAGCTVVMKPASPTPLSFRIIMDALAAAGVPAGVANLVTGPGRLGDTLVRHRLVSKVAFTGSTPVGRKIAGACGELLRPVTLELGGKSSALILPDADLEVLGSRLIRSCMRNTGQTCYISTRILAPARRYDQVVDVISSTISAASQGDPLDPATVFGPSANRSQYNSVLEHVQSGHAQGARAVTGGAKAQLQGELADGFFIQPTVFADVEPEMRISREEIFGPVITVLKYESEPQGIELANNTEFGLGGLVFGADEEHALRVAEQLDTGSVGLNFFASNHAAPFGGRHDSGLGTEYGPEGLAAYLSYKSIHRQVR